MLWPTKVQELWLAFSTWCMQCVGSAELDSGRPGILVTWCTAAQYSYLRTLLYRTQKPCLFSGSIMMHWLKILMHLNTKTKLKRHFQCLSVSNLKHYGLPSRCKKNRFFLSNKQIIQKDVKRFRKIFDVFFRRFYSIRRRAAIFVGIQFLDSIFDDFGSSFNTAALLPFFC